MQKKETLKALINIFNSFLYALLFLITIVVFYDSNVEFDYGVRGYIVLFSFYLFIVIGFMKTFGAYKLGNKRIMDICLSSSLSLLFADFTSYFLLGLIEGHLVLVYPFLLLLFVQLLLCVFLSYEGNKVIRFNFLPKKTLLVYGNKNYKEFKFKLERYQHYEFIIEKSISETKIISNNLKSLFEDYDCVITYEVNHELKKKIVKNCYENGKNVFDVPSILDVFIKSSEVTNFVDTPLFRINRMGPSVLESVIKRIADIFGASLLLFISSPVLLISAIIIKCQDGGDIFFKQVRLTKDGKEFNLVKFRSMVMNAEPNGKMIRARKNDCRITPFGKFIRQTRIDELPQIFNILKGDLSFVGPRALRIEEYKINEKKFPEFRYRLKVKAGLTGYAQIYGKYNTTFRDKLLLDIFYIENFDLVLDIKLILMTFVTVLTKDSTEGF